MARRHQSPHTHTSTTLVRGGSQKRFGSPVRNLQTCRVQIRCLAGCSALFVAVWGLAGCAGALPAAPGGAAPTLSGHIYQDHTASRGEPLLEDAIVTVTDADGSSRTAVSDRVGFYK